VCQNIPALTGHATDAGEFNDDNMERCTELLSFAQDNGLCLANTFMTQRIPTRIPWKGSLGLPKVLDYLLIPSFWCYRAVVPTLLSSQQYTDHRPVICILHETVHSQMVKKRWCTRGWKAVKYSEEKKFKTQATDTAEQLWEREGVTEFLSDLETSVTKIAMKVEHTSFQQTKVVLKHKELREAEVQIRGKTGEH